MWFDPDEKEIVNYIGVKYIVFGICSENYECAIGNVIIRNATSHPTPVGIEGGILCTGSLSDVGKL